MVVNRSLPVSRISDAHVDLLVSSVAKVLAGQQIRPHSRDCLALNVCPRKSKNDRGQPVSSGYFYTTSLLVWRCPLRTC